jgi:hypothetical protein
LLADRIPEYRYFPVIGIGKTITAEINCRNFILKILK